MIGSLLWTICALGFIAPVGGITLEECEMNNLPAACYTSLQTKMAQSTSIIGVCQALISYVSCIEEVACECNMTGSYELANAITYVHHQYDFNQCPDITGDLPDTKGFPCSKWGDTTGGTSEGQLLTLSLSITPYVLNLERNCSGFQSCYEYYDTEAALAMHNRNLTELCITLNRTIFCLENAACACGGENSTAIVTDIVENDLYYRQTCTIVHGSDMLPREEIKCKDGAAAVRTVCDAADPTAKCYLDYRLELTQANSQLAADCAATKKYMGCVEDIACKCGLIREWSVYSSITEAAHYYNTECEALTGSLTVTPGIQCSDGTGTSDAEDRVAWSLVKAPFLLVIEQQCVGVKQCYDDFEQGTGVALFQKNKPQLCRNSKLLTECLELSTCQCGMYNYTDVDTLLTAVRFEHRRICLQDAVLEGSFECMYGEIGFSCMSNRDCMVVANSKCGDSSKCTCSDNYKFVPLENNCAKVETSTASDRNIFSLLNCLVVLLSWVVL